jgi:uncharacterized membrane protein YhaH (DUF805 family)
MTIGQFLFSFSGRINRAKIWLFLLARIVYNIVAFSIFLSVIGFGTIMAVAEKTAPPETLTRAIAASMAMISLFSLGWLVIYFCTLAVGAKRLHDRNRSAWWLVVFYVLPVVLNLVRFFLVLGAMHRGATAQMDPAGTLLGGTALIIMLWGFIELYCLGGTAGDNRYGPDPLAGKAP